MSMPGSHAAVTMPPLRPLDPDAPVLRRDAGALHSPLRYPGGKRRLAPLVAEMLRTRPSTVGTFAEPFAGGASVALHVLSEGLAERVVLGEKDPLVRAFWETALYDTDWLIRRVETADVTLAEWNRLRASAPRSRRERAWKALFLNRTSFSGILSGTAGPIGGQTQTSVYDIACRFPRETLARRLRRIAIHRDRMAVVGRWQEALAEATGTNDVAYLDPPFFAKADRLYRYCFTMRQHRALAAALAMHPTPFLLSYDDASEIERLYTGQSGLHVHRVELLYSATERTRLVPIRELLVTNLAELPGARRLWRTNAEWQADAERPAASLVAA